jgi:ribosomal protein S18 acetylase RimI-like enzyme
MFTVRTAIASDKNKILELYKRVTVATPGGIARSFDEITETYIQDFMQESSLHGLEFVIDNPDDAGEIIAEIHCYQSGLKVFDHVLSELTIVVDPSFHNKGLGKLIFTHLLDFVTHNRPDILRVELVVKDSHTYAIALYKKIGFIAEGRFEKKFKKIDGNYDSDIPMVWFNSMFHSK